MTSSSRYGSPEEYRKRKVALISGTFGVFLLVVLSLLWESAVFLLGGLGVQGAWMWSFAEGDKTRKVHGRGALQPPVRSFSLPRGEMGTLRVAGSIELWEHQLRAGQHQS
jgi:hypothetical protein